jgi:hypothetical protein
MFVNASVSIEPQLDWFGEPRPRNSTPAWIRMARPNSCAAWMIVGPIATGRMCRRMMRPSPRPATRAAST